MRKYCRRFSFVYAVHYKFQGDDELKTAVVDHGGKVSTYDFGFNAVPKEALENVDTIKPFFTDSGERLGIVFNVIKIEDIRKMVAGKMSTH